MTICCRPERQHFGCIGKTGTRSRTTPCKTSRRKAESDVPSASRGAIRAMSRTRCWRWGGSPSSASGSWLRARRSSRRSRPAAAGRLCDQNARAAGARLARLLLDGPPLDSGNDRLEWVLKLYLPWQLAFASAMVTVFKDHHAVRHMRAPGREPQAWKWTSCRSIRAKIELSPPAEQIKSARCQKNFTTKQRASGRFILQP